VTPSVYSRVRILRFARFGRQAASLSILFRPRRFTRPRRFAPLGARGLVASRCRSWGSSRCYRDAFHTPRRTCSRSQPCRVTAVVAPVPFRRLRGFAPCSSWWSVAHRCRCAGTPSFLGFVPLQGPSCRGSGDHARTVMPTDGEPSVGAPVHTRSPCGGREDRLRRAGLMVAMGRRSGHRAHLRVERAVIDSGPRVFRRPEGRRMNEAVRFPNRIRIPPSVRRQRQAAVERFGRRSGAEVRDRLPGRLPSWGS
jgi:hypothetical protein